MSNNVFIQLFVNVFVLFVLYCKSGKRFENEATPTFTINGIRRLLRLPTGLAIKTSFGHCLFVALLLFCFCCCFLSRLILQPKITNYCDLTEPAY